MLAPNEPRVGMEHIVRQARGETRQRLFQIFSRQGAKEILVDSVARWEAHLRMLIVLERRSLELEETVEQLIEREARIVGYSDGRQDESAESRT